MHEFTLDEEGTVTTPIGFQAGAAAARIKEKMAPDVGLVVSDSDASVAAVFTKNIVAAAPVVVDRQTLQSSSEKARAVVANSGNANACTGDEGLRNARAMQRETAEQLSCDDDQVFVLSTGVIGHQLPMDKVLAGIEEAARQLSRAGGHLAAEAIMTTDTLPKSLSAEVATPDGTIYIGGMAKGSGMIHPNMATMLGVLTTDAKVTPELLQKLLGRSVDKSFNRISVDGDTSTNDTVLILANGDSGVSLDNDPDAEAAFGAALDAVCVDLAQRIVRDGEGANKFVELQITGADSERDAHRIAETIATSPLVKTAFAGGDANWGRILAAAGRSGVTFDPEAVTLTVGGAQHDELVLLKEGAPTDYLEADAASIFVAEEIRVHLQIGGGPIALKYWTTDLTHAYITINADYRT